MKKSIVILLTALSAYSVKAQSLSEMDIKFTKEAAEAGMKEIKLGQLAQTNGSSAEIKSLGQMMVTDHTKANNTLLALAKKKGIPVATALSEKEQKGYDDMAKKTGTDFDKAYAECMVSDHKKAVDLFKDESKNGQDSELKSFASATEPTLEHHKMMSEKACKDSKK